MQQSRNRMFATTRWLGSGVVVCLLALSVLPAAWSASQNGDAGFDERVVRVVDQFEADVEADRGFVAVLAGMLREEYRTPPSELYWASQESISWGHIAVLSYLQATTGRGFEELVDQAANARDDEFVRNFVADFVAQMEMSPDRMVQSLEALARTAVRERNSRIFDRLRSARALTLTPDLGAGFGLFQEALDFRQLGAASPTKVHVDPVFLVKGDGGKQ
jgi:hypothetical protein